MIERLAVLSPREMRLPRYKVMSSCRFGRVCELQVAVVSTMVAGMSRAHAGDVRTGMLSAQRVGAIFTTLTSVPWWPVNSRLTRSIRPTSSDPRKEFAEGFSAMAVLGFFFGG